MILEGLLEGKDLVFVLFHLISSPLDVFPPRARLDAVPSWLNNKVLSSSADDQENFHLPRHDDPSHGLERGEDLKSPSSRVTLSLLHISHHYTISTTSSIC